ncbi:hypothetical protein IFR05_003522 [Cadophora sp. M221]|nr:hypothetical protein IFR05_003522 [Cadophora sp. M221]
MEAADSSILGVTPTGKSHTTTVDHGFLAVINGDPDTLDFGPLEIQAKEIDFSLVKEWISFCSSDYRKSGCAPDSPDGVQDLQVIDFALSYVWGKVQPAQGADISSSPFPPVVQDSMSVTVTLGYQYLWVDRYCVDQNDNRKHIQLGQMDKIYSCAQLTLVAAAGEDADYGLPGVGSRF